MPLPPSGADTPWPPTALTPITSAYAIWDAWYTGDPAGLRRAYSSDLTPITRPSQRQGGVVGAVARWWWGRPATDTSGQRGQLHIPLAADLCQASADLLFAEPPTLKVGDAGMQDRLDILASDGLYATLAEAAEIGAALGGSYLRVTWDQASAPDAPFLTSVDADAVIPEFRWGRLTAATIWHRVATDGRTVWRHLERHETSGGTGVVLHGLYQGSEEDLGQLVPLTEHPSTTGLADLVDDAASISTESPGLALTYIPNQRPQRRWRSDPVGASLGRSDLDGVEGLMDALDETWSSWMRDIRLAKGHLIVPNFMLESSGPGRGQTFDADQEIWSPVNAEPGGAQQIIANQFAIRVAEHQATAQGLIDQILRTAGYSASTFGEDGDGGMATATEVNARQQRSDLTRDRKMRHWRPGIATAVAKLLAVDAALFSGPGGEITPGDVQVLFGDSVQDSPLELAQTAQALLMAEAASRRTRVALVHPDWDEDAIDAEVELIKSEGALADPAALGAGGAGLTGTGDGQDDSADLP